MSEHVPQLQRVEHSGVVVHLDLELLNRYGMLTAFSERRGGASFPPYDSLNLASHVGDLPDAVDENRRRLASALGVDPARLVTAEQVHGIGVELVHDADAGRGAQAAAGRAPVVGADALVTQAAGIPLMLLYADCVPIVLVDVRCRTVAVTHAGWRGALGGICAETAHRMLSVTRSEAAALRAYVGPHICPQHYEVSPQLMELFVDRFGTVAQAHDNHLDLGAVVRQDLRSAGIPTENVYTMGTCTYEASMAFYSYRASAGTCGRHAAVAAVLG